MDPYTDDMLAHVAAQAHRDAEPCDKRAARRHGRDRSTMNRWGNQGRGSPVYSAHRYIAVSADPFRVAASLLATAYFHAVGKLTNRELLALAATLGPSEKLTEGADSALDMTVGASLVARSVAKERDGALDLRHAAVLRELYRRRVRV